MYTYQGDYQISDPTTINIGNWSIRFYNFYHGIYCGAVGCVSYISGFLYDAKHNGQVDKNPNSGVPYSGAWGGTPSVQTLWASDNSTLNWYLNCGTCNDTIVTLHITAYETTPAPTLQSVTISPTTATIGIGGTRKLDAICKDTTNTTITCPSLTWTSSNIAIATVDSTGLVTGISVGTTNMTASSGSITSNVSAITVSGQIYPILTSIDPSTATISTGSTQQFTAKDQSGNAITTGVTWSVSGVGSISQTGLYSAGSTAGSATVTVTYSGVSKTATVTINPISPVLTSIAPSAITISIGSTQQFASIDQFGNAISTGVAWSSDNTLAVTIGSSSGIATGTGAGSTTITATYLGVSKTATMIVSPTVPILTSIVPPTSTISVGNTQQFTAIDQFGNAITTGVIWVSNNTLVATVNISTGMTTGINIGSATITATYAGVNKTATITVTPATSVLTVIEISPSSATVIIGNTRQFSAICKDQNGNTMACPIITWAVSDPIKGTISNTGLFTALSSSGTVIVTTTSGTIVGTAVVILSTVPTVQAGFGAVQMIIIAGIVVGAVYMATRKKMSHILT